MFVIFSKLIRLLLNDVELQLIMPLITMWFQFLAKTNECTFYSFQLVIISAIKFIDSEFHTCFQSFPLRLIMFGKVLSGWV